MSKKQNTEPLITLQGITKTYQSHGRNVNVLQDVSMTVHSNEMIAIMGPSGSGKSTLLFILGLFLLPSSGEYCFCGRKVLDLSRKQQAGFRRKRIGFVLQGADMFEHSTVYENIEFPLIYENIRPSQRPARINEVLEYVKLSHRIHHSSNKLSGGERQRVAIARAIVNKPDLILADEPTGQLDSKNSQQIMELFRSIAGTTKTAMIIVTHDPKVAQECDRILHIENGRLLSQ